MNQKLIMEIKKTIEVVETLKDHGIHYLNGDIGDASAKEVITWILESNLQKKKMEKLQLIVSSYGGDLTAAFAIIDVMRGSKIPVHTIGLGCIASCGLLIFMSGKRGYRTLTPNTSILSHQFSGWNRGKEHELLATVKEHSYTSNRIMEHYKKCTGLSDKIIREKLLPASDVWLDQSEALKYNLCDKIQDIK
jgi:ATP-dependent Clp protease protease subunit